MTTATKSIIAVIIAVIIGTTCAISQQTPAEGVRE